MDVRLVRWSDWMRSLRVGVSWLVAGLLVVAAAPGQDETPLPLLEIAPGQTEASGFAFVAANTEDRLLFWADDGRRGRELWFTDGTESGTYLWADFCPGECGIDLQRVQRIEDVAFDGRAAFVLTEDGVHGKELWWTQGTSHSTRFAADICRGDCDSQVRQLTLIGGRAYFEAWSSDFGSEPWISDGTRLGTYRLADLNEGSLGSFPRMFLPFGDGAVFLASSETTADAWWQTDGTPEGTELLADLCPGNCSILGVQALPFGDGILFGALLTDTQQFNLYRAAPGVALEQLQTLCQGAHCNFAEGPMVQLGERVYMTRDSRVWSSDGTVEGTRVEVQLPDTHWSVADLALLDDGTLLLMVDDNSTGHRVYRREVGGQLSAPLLQVGFRSSLHGLGDQAVIVNPNAASVDLWSTDGTTQGTVLYQQISTDGGWGHLSGFPTVLGDRVVFSVRPRDDFRLTELVSTGGVGTSLRTLWAVDQRPDSIQPSDLTSLGSRIVFRNNMEDALHDDLWVVDDSGNTQRIATEVEPEDLVAVQLAEGKRAFFASGDEYDARTPWLSDGSPDGTFALNDPTGPVLTWGREPVVLGGRLFFLADQGAGQKLWKTGVEEDSVELVADLQPDYGNVHVGCPVCSPPIPTTPIFPRELHVVGQGANARLVFVGGQDASGAELWQSDGTEAGTSLLFDLVPGQMGSEPEDLMPAGRGLIFTADVGEGRELFFWDGQSASPEALDSSREVWATTYNDARAVWMERREDGDFSIWTSDGTRSGTRYVTGVHGNTILGRSLVLFDNRLYFVAADGGGAELWMAYLDRDGTVTQRFDLWPGHRGSYPQELRLIGDQLYFSADDSITGRELWRLDVGDTGSQPIRLGEVAPGSAPSSPRDLALLEPSRPDIPIDFVLFSADDGEFGRELWAVDFPGNTAVCQTDATTLCLREGRFRVTVDWRDEIRGTEGVGQVSGAGSETGFFWFFEPNNLELTVKIIDGRDFNDAHWVFYGALSDVAYDITVEDLATGARRIYSNAQGNFCGQGDIEAFPVADAADLGFPKHALAEVPGMSMAAFTEVPGTSKMDASKFEEGSSLSKVGTCRSDYRRHCLLDRFEVSVDWTNHGGGNGIGLAASSNGQTGLFWFFNQDNIELAVKVIDGTDFNDSFWVFYGALTDVRYTLRVVDTVTGDEAVYQNPAGNLCGRGDTSAFPMMP